LTLSFNLGVAPLELLTLLFGPLGRCLGLGPGASDLCFSLSDDRADWLKEKALQQPYQHKKIDRLQRKRGPTEGHQRAA
jgi:hypothetical protein